MSDAYRQGYNMAVRMRSSAMNPYKQNTPEWVQWRMGWSAASGRSLKVKIIPEPKEQK